MLCVRAEDALAAAAAAAAASDKMRSVTLSVPLSNLQVCFVGSWSVLKVGSFRLRVCRGGTIQRAVRRMAGGRRRPGASADPGTGDASASPSASCSGVSFRFPL